jgi:hypothetical protein
VHHKEQGFFRAYPRNAYLHELGQALVKYRINLSYSETRFDIDFGETRTATFAGFPPSSLPFPFPLLLRDDPEEPCREESEW